MSVPFLDSSARQGPLFVHTFNKYLLTRLLVGGLIATPACLILGVLIDQYFNEKPDLPRGVDILWLIIFLTFFWGLAYLSMRKLIKTFGKKIEVYPTSIVLIKGKKRQPINLEQVVQIRSKRVIKLENLITKDTVTKMRIILNDASEIDIPLLSNIEQFEMWLQEQLAQRYLPGAIQAIQQGEVLQFGDKIQLDQNSIMTAKGQLLWHEIQTVNYNKGNLLIIPKGQVGAWDIVNGYSVPNRGLLDAIMKTLAR